MAFAPDGRLFVLEQGGNVELVRGDGSTWTALHLNVDSQGERGLLGIAFDPNFSTNHFVYLYYTNPNPGAAPWATGEHNQLSRFTVNDSNPEQPVFTDEAPILDWNTLSSATNHNGGAIHFGLDGMLYADAGDNAQTFTQGGNTYRVSQTLSDLLGKQLRINVGAFNQGIATRDDTTVGHLIPADNPFVGTASGIDQLIYALGLRNPYTFAVQPGTGTIFINDVGENTWEEIDQSVAGANFGWSGGNTDGFGQTPPGPGVYHDPLLAYNHTGGPAGGGIAIVGGAFYDPATAQFPASYVGKYFYGDLTGGWIRVFDPADPGSASNPDPSTSFATGIPGEQVGLTIDSAGNLYDLSQDGTVTRISYQAPSVVSVAPSITTEPAGQQVNAGQPAAFTVVATGTAPLSYQWQHLVATVWQDVGTNSPTYTVGSATTADAGSYRVMVFNSAGSETSDTALLVVNPSPPPPPPPPPSAVLSPGLNAEFFDFTTKLKRLPNLGGRVATVTRTDAAHRLSPHQGAPGLASTAVSPIPSHLRHTGLPGGQHRRPLHLYLSSSDGSKLWLDGKPLINNNGLHPMRQRSRTIVLFAGLHALRVDYFENTGKAGLIVSWSGPGIAKQVIPAGNLFQGSAAWLNTPPPNPHTIQNPSPLSFSFPPPPTPPILIPNTSNLSPTTPGIHSFANSSTSHPLQSSNFPGILPNFNPQQTIHGGRKSSPSPSLSHSRHQSFSHTGENQATSSTSLSPPSPTVPSHCAPISYSIPSRRPFPSLLSPPPPALPPASPSSPPPSLFPPPSFPPPSLLFPSCPSPVPYPFSLHLIPRPSSPRDLHGVGPQAALLSGAAPGFTMREGSSRGAAHTSLDRRAAARQHGVIVMRDCRMGLARAGMVTLMVALATVERRQLAQNAAPQGEPRTPRSHRAAPRPRLPETGGGSCAGRGSEGGACRRSPGARRCPRPRSRAPRDLSLHLEADRPGATTTAGGHLLPFGMPPRRSASTPPRCSWSTRRTVRARTSRRRSPT